MDGERKMSLFLIILLVVFGYFIFFGWILSRADGRWSVSVIFLAAFLIYGSAICFCAAMTQYLGELGLVLYGVAIVYVCLYWLWECFRLLRERPRLNPGVLLMLCAYILSVLYITIFMRGGIKDDRIQMEVFHWIASDEAGSFQHVLQNVAMLVPVGFLTVFAADGSQKNSPFLPAVSLGLFLSVLIETVQLIFHFGTCDIDDIIANLAGAAAGAGIALLCRGKRKSERKMDREME